MMDDAKVQIVTPNSAAQFEQYYQLRWEVLRAPWNQPLGSEQDALEAQSLHVLAINQNSVAIGVGRVHFLPQTATAQIRYMAVREGYRGLQIGKQILLRLETIAQQHDIRYILLEARENSLGFYTTAKS